MRPAIRRIPATLTISTSEMGASTASVARRQPDQHGGGTGERHWLVRGTAHYDAAYQAELRPMSDGNGIIRPPRRCCSVVDRGGDGGEERKYRAPPSRTAGGDDRRGVQLSGGNGGGRPSARSMLTIGDGQTTRIDRG